MVMFLSLKDTCRVPERWKIWATSVILAPCSRDASALGTQAMAKSAPPGQHRLRDDVDAALEDLHVEAVLLVEALVLGGEVARELGLGEPLQLQLHVLQWARSRGGRRRPGGRRWCSAVLDFEQAAATQCHDRRDPATGVSDGASSHRVSSVGCGSGGLRRSARWSVPRAMARQSDEVEHQAQDAGRAATNAQARP